MDALAARLARLVAHPTIAAADPAATDPAPFEGLHATLRALYPLLFERCEVIRVGAHGLLLRWAASGSLSLPKGLRQAQPTEAQPAGLRQAQSAGLRQAQPAEAGALVLMAHQDVVPVAGQDWTGDPFTAREVDGQLIGRGTLDDKGMLLVICEAVEALLGRGFEPARDVWVLLGDDEEVGGATARAAADLLRGRGVRPWLVLDEGGAVVEAGVLPGVDRPAAMIAVAEKGIATLRLTTTDAGGHASTPHRRGATARIARAVVRLERRPFPARLGGITREMIATLGSHAHGPLRELYARVIPLSPVFARLLVALGPETAAIARTTMAVTQLSGSPASNVLATRAEAVVNVRLDTDTRVADAVAHVRRAIADRSITVAVEGASEASRVSRTDDDRWALLVRLVDEVFPDAVAAPYVQNGATDSRRFSPWCDHVYRFAPLRMSDADRARIHAADEQVAVATLGEGVRFITRLIEEACS